MNPALNSAPFPPADTFRNMLDSIEQHVCLLDGQGVIRYVNQAWVAFGQSNGVPPEFEWTGQRYLSYIGEGRGQRIGPQQAVAARIQALIDGQEPDFELEYPCHSPTVKRWFLMRVSRLHHPETGWCVITHLNITSRKQAEQRVESLSRHDALTGLYNRRSLAEFFERERQRTRRLNGSLSLLMIDLDHFKAFNDEAGHQEGDRCLRQVARRIRHIFRRPSDLAVRYGGDEFLVVLGCTPLDHALQMANHLIQAIERDAFVFKHTHRVTASIGIGHVMTPVDVDLADLLKVADAAMYQAKADGRGRVVVAENL